MIASKKILIVEDNDINRAMLHEILSSQYQVLEAENGEEALAVLQAERDEISLILLDIIMPVMDGYTFLASVKNNPSFSSIPVIVTTQSDSESDEVNALSHGATDFVAKPYKPQVILHRVASMIELRETAAMVNQLRYDRLTGLYSKEYFYKCARELLLLNPDKKYDILCSDIENFKLINDVFGITAGDRLLCNAAQRYRELVGELGLCSRFQADQFVCILERQERYTDEIFIDAAARLNSLSGIKSVVMKWGIYPIDDKSFSMEQMCDWALLAAQSIKGQYGKYFAVYDKKLREKLLKEQDITDSMEAALEQGQFVVYLQPKFLASDCRLAGAEALVRWQHPEWGLQSPGEFIPLFERNGFITRLDQFVWEKACIFLRDWIDKGLPETSVSVNISRADIYRADVAENLLRLIRRYGLPPSALHLEITESAYTEDPEQIISTVRQLRQLGFVIEMDDFGSGYSSLNMLHQMPLDILKLDMKFIKSETAKTADQGILRFIMGLARSMNLSVTAEGVETREQLEHLQSLGCDFVQGYYLAKPMPAEAFETLLRERETEAAGEEAPSVPVSPGEDGRGQIILIAVEEEAYRSRLEKAFTGRFTVLGAADANAAFGYISGHRGRMAAVILSLTLPESFALLEALQKERAIWNTPVIAVARWDGELEKRALEKGADDFADRNHSVESLFRRTIHAMRMSALLKRERNLRQKAYQDFLSGLMNRWGLTGAVNSLCSEDGPLAVYLFDLDNLKYINDTYGHEKGDLLIQQFAILLQRCTREKDILARYGGDEFVVIMRHMKAREHAVKKGQEICSAFRALRIENGVEPACSVGVAVCDPADSLEDMIARADQALYRAKTGNKGGCCLWTGEGPPARRQEEMGKHEESEYSGKNGAGGTQ